MSRVSTGPRPKATSAARLIVTASLLVAFVIVAGLAGQAPAGAATVAGSHQGNTKRRAPVPKATTGNSSSTGNSSCGNMAISPSTAVQGGEGLALNINWTATTSSSGCQMPEDDCPSFAGTCDAGYWLVGTFCNTLALGDLASTQGDCDLNNVVVLSDDNSGPDNSGNSGTSFNTCTTLDDLGDVFGGLPATTQCVTDGESSDGWSENWPTGSTSGSAKGTFEQTGSGTPFDPPAGVDCPPSAADVAAGAIPNTCAFVLFPVTFDYDCVVDECTPDTSDSNDGVSEITSDYLATTFQYAYSPGFTSSGSVTAQEGSPLSYGITTSGSPAATVIETGQLPNGVVFSSLGAGDAVLNGTPGTGSAGTYPLTLTASNGVAPDAVQHLTLTVAPPPAIASISPDFGQPAGATTVAITGTNLAAVTGVAFGSVAATNVTLISPTEVTAVSPAGSGSVAVSITTPSGVWTSPVQFTYIPPTVTGMNAVVSYEPSGAALTPLAAQFGTMTLSTGETFDPSTLVITGEPASGTATADTTTGVITYAPTSSTSGVQTIVFQLCESGSIACSTGTLTAEPAISINGAFAVPLVGGYANYSLGYGSDAPSTVTPGSTMTESFAPAPLAVPDTFNLDGSSATVNYADGFTYDIPVPANAVYVANSAYVVGGDATTAGQAFVTYCAATDGVGTCTATAPNSDFPTSTTTPYLEVQLGSNIQLVPGATATMPTVVAQFKATGAVGTTIEPQLTEWDTGFSLTVGSSTIDATLATYPVAPSFTAGSSAPAYYAYPLSVSTVVAAPPTPTVSRISPLRGPLRGGTMVTVKGTNLEDASVEFGTTAAEVTAGGAKSITVVAPAGSGTVAVTVTTAGGTTTAPQQFSYIARPTVTSVSPASGSMSGGTAITITGTGFVAGAKVTIGIAAKAVKATDVVVVSPTEITAVTGASTWARLANLQVTTAGGTSSTNAGDKFAYVVADSSRRPGIGEAFEETHADWLETRIEMIGPIGDAHYLRQQVRT